ncbi:MAG: hypothetical protein ACREO0_03145 [Pseudoxanthomonas sp.]
MTRDNAVPYFALGLLAVAILYLWVISGQPRMADGGLSGDEMNLAEKALCLTVPFSVIAAMFVAMRRAYRVGSWFWFLACLFVWPLTFVYTLLVNRTNGR